jgi:hypothetical protein
LDPEVVYSWWGGELEGLEERLARHFTRPETRRRAQTHLKALLGPVERKTAGGWLKRPETRRPRASTTFWADQQAGTPMRSATSSGTTL